MHSNATSLATAVSHAVAFLTRPLSGVRSPATINKLQLILEASLIAAYAPTWEPLEPLHGSGRRCLTLSPLCLPPRPIHGACTAANVDWFDWMALMGGREFYLFVDPGCVSYRLGHKGQPDSKVITIWADEIPSPAFAMKSHSYKTLAQQLLEADREQEEEIFTLIDEAREPKWLSPIDTNVYRAPKRSTSPFSSISNHSRSSSSSSMSNFSFGSSSATSSPSSQYQSRRERARQTRIFVDASKTEVTPYDGGKTTVLTGGVMLGGSPSPSKHARQSSNSWRVGRV